MSNCENCSHAIFDTYWGEYKCDIKERVIYETEEIDCIDFKNGEPRESKDIPEVK